MKKISCILLIICLGIIANANDSLLLKKVDEIKTSNREIKSISNEVENQLNFFIKRQTTELDSLNLMMHRMEKGYSNLIDSMKSENKQLLTENKHIKTLLNRSIENQRHTFLAALIIPAIIVLLMVLFFIKSKMERDTLHEVLEEWMSQSNEELSELQKEINEKLDKTRKSVKKGNLIAKELLSKAKSRK